METNLDAMNEAIGTFMGYKMYDKRYPRNHGIGAPEAEPEKCMIIQKAKYHSSWDLLMPVVEKIEKLENGRFGFTIDPWGIDIIDYKGVYDGHREQVIVNVNREPSESTLLNDYYDAACQFIQWYNKQKGNE